MAFPIKFLLLQKSELMYEVAIRGETPSENVAGLRRQVNKLTQLYPSEDIIDSVYEFSDDIKGIQDTLEKVKINLDLLKSNLDEPLLNRTKSLLHHLFYRLQRIEKPGAVEETSLLKRSKKFYESFCESLTSLSKSKLEEPKVLTSAIDDDASSPNLTSISGLNISVSCDRGLVGELAKLKYDGKTCVRSFIQKLEEFKHSKSISEDKMLLSAFDIFTGDALHWYRNVRNKVKTWNDLILILKDDFDRPDYDYLMTAEIRQRTQGDDESITVYLSIMDGMFSRLSNPLTEESKLEIILHNIRPSYSTIIAASPFIKTIEDVRNVCKNYERIKVRSESFKEPPVASMNTLAPEFSYQSSKRKNYNPQNVYSDSQKRYEHPQQNNYKVAEIIKKPYCFRCRVDTHSMKNCTAERSVFCFRCGKKDVRIPECPVCNPKN